MAYEEIKEQIKSYPLSLILGQFMALKKQGTNSFVGLCPFHSDSNPSLSVNDQKGIFKCFVCGVGGDAISFVSKKNNIPYKEALKVSAQILGLSIEELNKEKPKNPKIELAFRVLNVATKIYRKIALQGTMDFKKFKEARKLADSSIETFQIGYASHQQSISYYLDSIPEPERKNALQAALDMGLIKPNQRGAGYYDMFRDRVIFPIHDHSGQVRGFSSRAVLKDQIPKYLNSSDSFIFHKGSILFGFFNAKNHIRQKDRVIVVEGNMDVIMMHQHSFYETVATMGIALSEQSVKLLSNLTTKIYLAMDSDPAGIKAMNKINATFLQRGILTRFIDFNPAKDPDEFLVNHGRLALEERIEKSPFYLDYLIDQIIPAKIPDNLHQKLELLKQVFQLIAPLEENLLATERLLDAAKRLQLKSDTTSILDDYRSHLKGAKPKVFELPRLNEKNKNENEVEETSDVEKNILDSPVLAQPLHEKNQTPLLKGESHLLATLLTHPECLEDVIVEEILAYVMHDEVKNIIRWLMRIYKEIDEREYINIVSGELFSEVYNEEINSIASEALLKFSGNRLNDKVKARLLKDLKAKMQLEILKEKRNDFKLLQQKSTSTEEIDFYMSEITKIDRELHNLKQNPSTSK